MTEQYDLNIPDRFEKRVLDGHAANQVLHDTLHEAESIGNIDLMASHAPGEKPNGPAPTYHVWVEFVNEGQGHPTIRDPVSTLIKRESVKLCDVVECSDDHLTVALRPIETTVEPIQVKKRDIPESLREQFTENTEADL